MSREIIFHEIEFIDMGKLTSLLSYDDVKVIDVRSEEEYAYKHLFSSINIPLSKIASTPLPELDGDPFLFIVQKETDIEKIQLTLSLRNYTNKKLLFIRVDQIDARHPLFFKTSFNWGKLFAFLPLCMFIVFLSQDSKHEYSFEYAAVSIILAFMLAFGRELNSYLSDISYKARRFLSKMNFL
jgi:rhodanese-related sulfurtransferase